MAKSKERADRFTWNPEDIQEIKMSTTEQDLHLATLINKLDEAVESSDGKVCCYRVKAVLEDAVCSANCFLDERHTRSATDRYARNLVHIDPKGRYSVIAMVWGHGQGTPIHDHDNMWCCECVVKGRIKVVSYRLLGGLEDELVDFKPELEIFAGPGEAGALIPPFDHHTIENMEAEPSVTLHVYGGEMTHCHVFLPLESGGYERVERQLVYTTV